MLHHQNPLRNQRIFHCSLSVCTELKKQLAGLPLPTMVGFELDGSAEAELVWEDRKITAGKCSPLIGALLMEIHECWQTGRTYLDLTEYLVGKVEQVNDDTILSVAS
jgi:hypothetical protein